MSRNHVLLARRRRRSRRRHEKVPLTYLTFDDVDFNRHGGRVRRAIEGILRKAWEPESMVWLPSTTVLTMTFKPVTADDAEQLLRLYLPVTHSADT